MFDEGFHDGAAAQRPRRHHQHLVLLHSLHERAHVWSDTLQGQDKWTHNGLSGLVQDLLIKSQRNIGTVSLLNSERAPAIYHLNVHLRNGLKTLKPAIINSWFTLSWVLPFFVLYLLLSIYFLNLFSVFSCILFVL